MYCWLSHMNKIDVFVLSLSVHWPHQSFLSLSIISQWVMGRTCCQVAIFVMLARCVTVLYLTRFISGDLNSRLASDAGGAISCLSIFAPVNASVHQCYRSFTSVRESIPISPTLRGTVSLSRNHPYRSNLLAKSDSQGHHAMVKRLPTPLMAPRARARVGKPRFCRSF